MNDQSFESQPTTTSSST